MAEPRFLTFGCRLNAFETEVMRDLASQAGLADAIVVNTCAVTGEAERKARQAIRRARRLNPDARIIVTGCAAQIDPKGYSAMTEVDHVIGNIEKMRGETFALLARSGDGDYRQPREQVGDIMTARETAHHLISGFGLRARAFVEIQQGCDHRCTFCIIPMGRGANRSVPMGEIVARVRSLLAGGVSEIVLTGVDITGYGADLPGAPSLGQLCRRLLALLPELKRLRLSSIDIAEADDEFWSLLATEPRLMPHLHLSLQSGDDLILKRMKRRHNRRQAIEFAARARALRPDIALGADLIAGFPTETEDMFSRSLDLIDEAGLAFTHVFRYSQRKGTPAARMPQVPGPLREERAARLRARGEAALSRYLDGRVGSIANALIEVCDGALAKGHGDDFAPIHVAAKGFAPALAPGQVVALRIVGRGPDHLLAEAA